MTARGEKGLTGVLLATARLADRLRRGLLYAGAGTMRIEQLRGSVARSWDEFNTTDHEVNAGLNSWEQGLVDRFVKPGSRVVIVGCGAGRDMIPLARLGCHVTGIEPSAPAAARARAIVAARRLDIDVVDGFVEDVALPGEVDVVIFSSFCFSYVPVGARRVAILTKLRAHLSAHGVIVASVHCAERPPAGRSIGIGRLAGRIAGSDWRVEEGDSFDLCGGPSPLFVYEHVFSPGELAREAAAAGLRLDLSISYSPEQPFVVFTAL